MADWHQKISPTVQIGFSSLKSGTALEVIIDGVLSEPKAIQAPQAAAEEGVILTKQIVKYCRQNHIPLVNKLPNLGEVTVRATMEQIEGLARQPYVGGIMWAQNKAYINARG